MNSPLPAWMRPGSIATSCCTSTREQRPGLCALLDYGRPGDAIVVVGIDRLGRNAAEVMATIQSWVRVTSLRSLREGIDTSNATGRLVADVFSELGGA